MVKNKLLKSLAVFTAITVGVNSYGFCGKKYKPSLVLGVGGVEASVGSKNYGPFVSGNLGLEFTDEKKEGLETILTYYKSVDEKSEGEYAFARIENKSFLVSLMGKKSVCGDKGRIMAKAGIGGLYEKTNLYFRIFDEEIFENEDSFVYGPMGGASIASGSGFDLGIMIFFPLKSDQDASKMIYLLYLNVPLKLYK